MAQTDTYANLLALIEAYSGSEFIAIERTRIKALVNARAHAAYRESELWESFLVGEERTVNGDNTVPYEGAVYTATSGSRDANTAVVDTFLRAHKENPWSAAGSVREYDFYGNATGAQLVGYQTAYGQAKTIDFAQAGAGTVTVQCSELVDFYVGGGIKVANVETGTVDINGEHTVTNVVTAAYQAGYTQVQYKIADGTGAFFSLSGAETVEAPTAFMTYKKLLTGTTYGNGAGETSAVPIEWFEYLALGVYADMLAADGFHDKSLAWEGRANKALQRELERIDAQRGHQFIRQRVRTHQSNQARQVSSL